MKLFILACLLLGALVQAEDVRLLDLEPNDAQQLIESKDTSLKYAPKIETNVPAVRYLGNEPHNVVEDIYLANQYHGQDGLGGYLYGYSVPDIAKTERKQAGGDLKGAYNYIAGDGQEIKVEYWDDGTGFHQVDNVPKILPKQIPDTPEVQAAKDEHARIWREQAERNSHPIANPYNNEGQYASGPLSAQGQIQRQQQFAQQPQYHGQPAQNQGQYQAQGQYNQPQGQYSQPQAQFSQPQGQHSQPQAQFNQPQGQHNQPQAQFTQPQSQYGQGQIHGQGGQYQPQQTQTVTQYQAKPVLTQTQDQNDIYSGQYSENRNSYSQGQQGLPQGQHSQPQGQYSQHQGQQSQQAHGQQGQYQPQQGQQQQGQYQQGQYQQGQHQQGGAQQQGRYEEEEEVTGPPKGFFYNFDYPVGIIVNKDGGPIVKRDGNIKDIYSENKAHFEAQLSGQVGGQGGSYLVQ